MKQKREYQEFGKGSGSRLPFYLVKAGKEVIRDFVQEVVQGFHLTWVEVEKGYPGFLFSEYFK